MSFLFGYIARNADLMVALAVVGVVVMMVIPLPSFLLDLLMSINLAVSLVLVITATYIDDPLEFSVFPSLLLITTLFRLALNVSSTRLILLEGAAFDGEVVRAFGNFVVGGNYVVGLIIFIILVIVQFMVITKGSERVAEVAARFTLDAMPGKQMAIDADLGAGLIDETTARSRREKIQKTADFYGSMDGASKFVKGDTVAGIIITVINIIGGMIIGYFSGAFRTLADIASTYTILTVGDGLVSIIPSLLISVATGIIVTRSASEKNLGGDLMDQILSRPKAILIGACVFLLFAMVPGLPKVPFILISLLLFGVAWVLFSDAAEAEALALEASGGAAPSGRSGSASAQGSPASAAQAEAEPSQPEDVSTLLQVDTLELEIGYALIPMADPNQGGDLLSRIKAIRRQMAQDLGLVIPAIRIRDNLLLSPNNYSIKLKGIEIGKAEVFPDMFLAMDPGMVVEKVPGNPTKEPAFNLDAIWIEEELREKAEINGYTVVDAPSVVATHITELIKRHSSEILGRQETSALIDKLREKYPAVVDAVIGDKPAQQLGLVQKVLQMLLREGVSIRNLSTIIEVIADSSGHVKNLEDLTELVRQGLARQITHEYVLDGVLSVLTLEPNLEHKLAEAVQKAGSIHQAMDPDGWQRLFDNLNSEVEQVLIKGLSPVLVCSPVIRYSFKKVVERVSPQLVVLSYQEIVIDVQIDNIGTISAD
ncbi:MAG: flagellar biosynthesis protein FlhA [Candidatus Cloacimonetes bacterium]|nr:flagellar biosynthesis protein FlhA [Candidatus Cloacimonadota bacterium]